MSVLACPSCGEDVDVGRFPVPEGRVRRCLPCNLALVVRVSEDSEAPWCGWASLREQPCDDCGSPGDSSCARCGGTGCEPANPPAMSS